MVFVRTQMCVRTSAVPPPPHEAQQRRFAGPRSSARSIKTNDLDSGLKASTIYFSAACEIAYFAATVISAVADLLVSAALVATR